MELNFLTVIDIIGILSFAVSGAMVGIRKKLDMFGVNILAIVTSTAGGCLRDLMIGRIPPQMFRTPFYVFETIIIANIVFLIVYFKVSLENKTAVHIYERTMFWFDTLGLASFTLDGIIICYEEIPQASFFLALFLGVLTGTGGGILRDMMVNEIPGMFVKHIYAVASIVGAAIVCALWNAQRNIGLVCGFAVIVVIRFLAAKYRWNLPVADTGVLPEHREIPKKESK